MQRHILGYLFIDLIKVVSIALTRVHETCRTEDHMGQQYCQDLATYFAYVRVLEGASGHPWGRKEVGAGNSLWLVKGRLCLPEGNTLLPLFIICTPQSSNTCFPGLCFSSSSFWPFSLLHPQVFSSSSYLTSIPLSFGWQYSVLPELLKILNWPLVDKNRC